MPSLRSIRTFGIGTTNRLWIDVYPHIGPEGINETEKLLAVGIIELELRCYVVIKVQVNHGEKGSPLPPILDVTILEEKQQLAS
jgi:hypothetical protein